MNIQFPMVDLVLQYPIFGPEILCPHCFHSIPALTLTDAYLCNYHGAFEADPKTQDLIHLNSGRSWRQWEGAWYRQHTHPDGIRFEIHEALDRLYAEGYRATQVIIAQRYRSILTTYFQRTLSLVKVPEVNPHRLYGLPVSFSPPPPDDPRWLVINFDLKKAKGDF